jgi:RNA polymerase sigma-70 factor (family 1)
MTDCRSFTDAELIALLKQGDRAAFAEIFDRHWGSLYIHAEKMLHDREEARDIVQEVFISLWDKAGEREITSSLSAYLFSSTRNKVLNLIRDKKTRSGYINLFALYIEGHHNDTLEFIEEKELLGAIEAVIQSLPEKMRKVFELSRKEHLSHKEIAAKLDISDGTVKRQISNALHVLRTELNKPEALILAILLGHIK